MSAGKLSIVATPIGNLKDITLRALETLSAADVILCEDTRVTKKLLAAQGIEKPLLSYHAHSGETKTEKILKLLREGRHAALTTDAGTPGVSDPGGELVARVREEVPEAVIETIPGASALTATLSVAGVKAQPFVFYGFLPHKKGRESLVRAITKDEKASVFFESTHRLRKALESLAALCPERKIAVCKELTKMHEAVWVGRAGDILKEISSDSRKERGEFVVIVEAL